MQNEEDKEDSESTSSGMESAAYDSPDSGSKTQNIDQSKVTTTTDGRTVENKITILENKSPSNMKVLEDRIIALKHEIEILNCQKGEHEHETLNCEKGEHEHEQEFKGRRDEFHKKFKENSGFQLEFAFKEKESEVLKKLGECEKFFKSKIEESMDWVQNLELEVDSLRSQYNNFSNQKEQELEALRIKNQDSEFQLSKKTKEASVSLEMLERLTVQNQETEFELSKKTKEASDSLEMLERLTVQNQETESELSKKTKEASKSLEMLERLTVQNQETEIELSKKTKEAFESREVLERLTEKLKQKTEDQDALKQQVKDLVVIIESINDENHLSKSENENQRTTISQLQEELQQKDSQISTLESEIEGVQRDLSNKMKSLEQKYKSLELDKVELEGKNDVLAASLEQKDTQVNKLNHEAHSSFQATVKKMGEMVDEFRKKSEDSVRILSRRICVAEQLHNETRDWYKKTWEKNEQDRKDGELALRSIKIMISMVSDTLSVSETFGLRFVECCEEFTNRVSKVCCEINFVKEWMRVKNGALVQVKKDFDELVVQLDDKEQEILDARQKVLKLGWKLRVLKKIVKENDETMIVLKEEKREAIRQLCVWNDYHRGRSDFFKKAFFELVGRYTRPGYPHKP